MAIGHKAADLVKRYQIILVAADIYSSEPVGKQGEINDDHAV